MAARVCSSSALNCCVAAVTLTPNFRASLIKGAIAPTRTWHGTVLAALALQEIEKFDNQAGEQVQRVAKLALSPKKSVDFNGYWQRHRLAI
jgi:hypothetical protein